MKSCINSFVAIVSLLVTGHQMESSYNNPYPGPHPIHSCTYYEQTRGQAPTTDEAISGMKEKTYQCKELKQCTCVDTLRGKKVLCDRVGFTEIPNNIPNDTFLLDISNNNIADISNGVLKNATNLRYLFLENNNITTLKNGAFEGLTDLVGLDLSLNKIRYTNLTIQRGVLAPLTNLKCLYIEQDLGDISRDESYPVTELNNLKKLAILWMDGLPNSNISFSSVNIPSLDKLVFWGPFGRCELGSIHPNMFVKVANVTFLAMRNCSISVVEQGSFAELPKLSLLDLAYNPELEFKSLPNITAGLINTSISIMDVSKIHKTSGDCTRLEKEQLINMPYLPKLISLSLNSNRLSYIEVTALPFFPKTLEVLALRNNLLLDRTYIIFFQQHLFLQCLRQLDISSQKLTPDIRELLDTYKSEIRVQNTAKLTTHAEQVRNEDSTPFFEASNKSNAVPNEAPQGGATCTANVESTSPGKICGSCRNQNSSLAIKFSPLLKILDMSDMRVRTVLERICICSPNVLETLMLNRNMYWAWLGPFTGFQSLKDLNLAWNSCGYIHYTIFHEMPLLERLNLSRNFLGFPLSKDVSGITFGKLTNLTDLDLSDNKIRYLPKLIFKGLVSLKSLYLHSNEIIQTDFVFSFMHSLRYINFTGNLIEVIPEHWRNDFDKIAHYFRINFSHNRFKCNCKTLDFMAWLSSSQAEAMLTNRQSYKCQYDNDTFGNLTFAEDIYSNFKKECADYTPIIIGTTIGLLAAIALVFGGIIHRYRWDLRYMYYSAKFRMKGYAPISSEDDEDYVHDVFVSYADEDRAFVRYTILSELEEKRGLKVLVHDRDFMAGNFVTDNIMKAIKTSRKTLIVLTRAFFRSTWCKCEMNLARMEGIKNGRDVICVLKKENVSLQGISLEICDVIREQTYADLQEEARNDEQFWDDLKSALLS